MLTATGLSRTDIEAAGHKMIRRAGKQVLLIAHEGADLRHRQSLPA